METKKNRSIDNDEPLTWDDFKEKLIDDIMNGGEIAAALQDAALLRQQQSFQDNGKIIP